jgi:hypothetical protein
MLPGRYPQPLDQFSLRIRQPGELFNWSLEHVQFHLQETALPLTLPLSPRASQRFDMEL